MPFKYKLDIYELVGKHSGRYGVEFSKGLLKANNALVRYFNKNIDEFTKTETDTGVRQVHYNGTIDDNIEIYFMKQNHPFLVPKKGLVIKPAGKVITLKSNTKNNVKTLDTHIKTIIRESVKKLKKPIQNKFI